jgi:streptogramin lyase
MIMYRLLRISTLVATTLTTFAGVLSAQPAISKFVIPGGHGPYGITSGSDGAIWFTERLVSQIGRLTTSLVLTEYPIPTGSSRPTGITSGPDGNLWFTEEDGNKIGRITTAGIVTEFPLPSPASAPIAIAAGPDGRLWFTEQAGRVGAITVSGGIAEFTLPSGGSPKWIAQGPDGNLWFTEFDGDLDGNVLLPGGGNRIGRITPSGSITEFSLAATPARGPFVITPGPDGNLWFTERAANMLGQITPAGVISEFPVPTPTSFPFGITTGHDGNLWFTEAGAFNLGRLSAGGAFAEFPMPHTPPPLGNNPYMITNGPDGNLWITQGPWIVTVTIPPPSVSVPTAGETALIYCGILLGATGVWFLRRAPGRL